uniref:Uncharacterized protein n=1 Tax=Faecalibaculum rodentium TaxID=1702221 RepID=A0A140DVT7_9FIRM|nr:hypothetical protein AALO17_16300 [Faecalibaculum rodentium]
MQMVAGTLNSMTAPGCSSRKHDKSGRTVTKKIRKTVKNKCYII